MSGISLGHQVERQNLSVKFSTDGKVASFDSHRLEVVDKGKHISVDKFCQNH